MKKKEKEKEEEEEEKREEEERHYQEKGAFGQSVTLFQGWLIYDYNEEKSVTRSFFMHWGT